MKKVAVSLLLLIALIPSGVRSETWQSKVSFEVPASWKLLKSKTTDTVVVKLYLIRKDIIGPQTHASNALVQYYPVPKSVTMAKADGIVASHTKGATRILSTKDGPFWKTYLLVNYERNQQYIVLYRIGMVDSVCLEVMLSFPPVVDKKDTSLSILTLNETYVEDRQMAGVYCNRSSVREMVDVFNSMCERLTISGRNQYKADARIIDPPANEMETYRHKGEDNDGK